MDILDDVVELFERLRHEAGHELYIYFQSKQNIYCTAPKFIIDLFKQGLSKRYYSNQELSAALEWHGIKFQIGYEMAIILHHELYPLYNKEGLVVKIPLNPPYKMKEEWYDKYLFKIKDNYIGWVAKGSDN